MMGGHSILIVDDNASFRQLMRIALELEGYEVLEADGCNAALAKLEEHSPDLILQDLMFQGDDGRRIAVELKKKLSDRSVPIIACSGSAAALDVADCLPEPVFDGWVQKPVLPSALVKKIGRHFASFDTNLRRVLVVDDVEINATLLRLIFERERCLVKTAGSVAEAVAVIEEFKPQLILLDPGLPDADGLNVVQRVKQEIDNGDIVVVAVASDSLDSGEMRARAAGCAAFILKPIDTRRIVGTILRAAQEGAMR